MFLLPITEEGPDQEREKRAKKNRNLVWPCFGGSVMNVYEARNELKSMNPGVLFKLAANQRISKCLIGGAPCVFYLHYREFNFCISELLGQSCQIERAKRSEGPCGDLVESGCPLPFMKRPGTDPVRKKQRTRNPEFRVYCRDEVTRSIILLGRVIERRARERGNNLRDLLRKAVNDYSDRVADPSTIFLLGP